jgi:hypothetical protein
LIVRSCQYSEAACAAKSKPDGSREPPGVAERNTGIVVVLVRAELVVVEDHSADKGPKQKETEAEREWDQDEGHENLLVESRRRPG